MADEFRAGDIAVCVNADLIVRDMYTALGNGLRVGAMYRVLGTTVDEDDYAPVILCAENTHGWLAERFKKLPPASDEFIRSIRACRPARTPVAA